VTDETRLLFIANPNNPTGTIVDEETIDRFMAKIPAHVVVVFDEAYYEFVADAPDTLKYVREGRNVIVLRTFSKAYGLAGLRVGYGLGSPQVTGILQKARQPFNTNEVAQRAALASLADRDHVNSTVSNNAEGLAFYEVAFQEMGLEYVPSRANFVLVNVGDGDRLFAEMLKQGVIVRAMRGYKLPGWVRISVGTKSENERCLEVMKSVISTF